MSTRSKTIRNTLFSTVGVYTEFALGMLTSIIIARHLGPDGFGAYSVVIWLVAMGVATTNSGTASAAIKFVAELRGGGNDALIPSLIGFLRRAQRIFMLIVVLAGAGLFLFAGERIAPGMDHRLLLVFLAMAIGLRAAYMFNIGVAKGFENFRATAVVALVSAPVNLALVLAAWWFDASVEWLLAVFLVSSVIFYLVSARQVAPLLPAGNAGTPLPAVLAARVRRHMWISALTVTMTFLAASEVEVLFLNLYTGADAAGQFKAAYQLAKGAAMLVPGVFGALLLPMMAHAVSQGGAIAGQRFAATTGYLTLLAAPLVAYGAVFTGAIVHVLFGDAYAAAAPAFALCLAGAAITSMTQGGSSLLISADRQGSLLLLVMACALVKIALDVILILEYGLMGGVWAYLIVSVICAVAIMVLAMRASAASPDWGRLLRIMLAAAVAGLVTLPLRDHLLPLAAILVGGALLVAVYAPLTLLFGCWSRGDIEHIQHLHQRFAAGRPRIGARFLEWARQRAPEPVMP